MSLTLHISTNNHNKHVETDAGGVETLAVNLIHPTQTTPGVVWINHRVWLECHDSSINAHKYYEIIETMGGKVCAFWGRIFKDGMQEPKFGEIKRGSFASLLRSKTSAGDYKIYTEYKIDSNSKPVANAIPEPENFALIVKAKSTSKYNPRFRGGFTRNRMRLGKPPVTAKPFPPLTTLPSFPQVPNPPSGPQIPNPPTAHPSDNPQIMSPELTDKQKIILEKLKGILDFSKSVSVRIEEMCRVYQRNGKIIWDDTTNPNSIFWSAEVKLIVEKIEGYIKQLSENGVVTKENLENCNSFFKTLTNINEVYKTEFLVKTQ